MSEIRTHLGTEVLVRETEGRSVIIDAEEDGADDHSYLLMTNDNARSLAHEILKLVDGE